MSPSSNIGLCDIRIFGEMEKYGNSIFASLKRPSKNILRRTKDNHDQSGLSLIISRVMVEKQPLRPGETKEPIACRMKTRQMSITLILDNHQLIIPEIIFEHEKSRELP